MKMGSRVAVAMVDARTFMLRDPPGEVCRSIFTYGKASIRLKLERFSPILTIILKLARGRGVRWPAESGVFDKIRENLAKQVNTDVIVYIMSLQSTMNNRNRNIGYI